MNRKAFLIFGYLLILLFLCGTNGYSSESAIIRATATVEAAIGFEPATGSGITYERQENLKVRLPAFGHVICLIESGDKVSERILGNSGIEENLLLDEQVLFMDEYILNRSDDPKSNQCTVTIIYTEN